MSVHQQPAQQWAPPPPHPHRKKSSTGKTMVIVGAAILLMAIVGTVAKTATEDTPATKPTVNTALTAEVVVDRLGDLYPLPNPTDNTGACAAQEGDTGKGCLKLITTDAVSVYEFEDASTARLWVTKMGKLGDWRQAGRFALAWTARDQDLTSKEARTEMITALKKWVAGEG